MFLILSLILLGLGYTLVDTMGIWLLFFSQVVLLLCEVRKGQVSGTSGFIFMSLLFFGIRPLYITIESDYSLILGLFRINPEFSKIHENMVLATLALVIFKLGSVSIQSWKKNYFQERAARESSTLTLVPSSLVRWLVFAQMTTLPIMQYMVMGGQGLYGSAFGAFVYDFPIVMQAVHVFSFVVILERYLQRRHSNALFLTISSGILFLFFTWLMREVSMFRGFYLAGVMIVGIAALNRILLHVSMLWLILPILVLQPLFQTLGGARYLDNDSLKELNIVERTFDNDSIGQRYWKFYDSGGDINIFDTFVAARASDPQVAPYLWSWIYAPFHVIPRKLWSGKPEAGITQDTSFLYGAPYSPGISGFFWLDGGGSDLWMIVCMAALGAIIGYLDGFVLSMRNSYLQACLLGIIIVNAMFLTRFFLWQALWQALYAVVPILLMNRFLAPDTVSLEEEEEEDGTNDQPN
jgi:hypothetical protein